MSNSNESPHEKTCFFFFGFRAVYTNHGVQPEQNLALRFAISHLGNSENENVLYIHEVKTKALISCAITASKAYLPISAPLLLHKRKQVSLMTLLK